MCGLQKVCQIIVLLQFIHIDFLGLVNGCQGIVKKIGYLPGSDVHINPGPHWAQISVRILCTLLQGLIYHNL
jgi:hypothetical protein